MQRFLPVLVALCAVALVIGMPLVGQLAFVSSNAALAASQQVTLAPGDSLTITCTTQLSGKVGTQQANLTCAAAPTPTAVVSATSTPAPTGQTPVAGQLCPAWVHDRYVARGPDGNMYPTWHPPIDQQYSCYFGHEHGADPLTSHANGQMPAFGYAAATMGMTEPHAGFKVFVMNAGDTVESNIASKVADEDVRFVFHMGTGGVARYTQEFHSFQLDYVDRSGSGRYAHLSGMTDTGPTERDGSTCSNPRQGAKDFSTLGCSDTYEIWNFTKFQILHPNDPFTGINESRFGMLPSFAVFDPITTRDPANNTQLVYTQDVKPNPGNVGGVLATSPQAYYQGCRREFYSGPLYWHNAGQQTTYYTDAMGRVAPGGPDAQHPLMQQLSASSGSKTTSFKDRTDYCGNNIRPPN